jgi:hypothetical protein
LSADDATPMINAEAIAQLLIKYVRIYFEDVDNADEYKSEAELIHRGLLACDSEESCLGLVLKVFRSQFAGKLYGSADLYAELSRELWRMVAPDPPA